MTIPYHEEIEERETRIKLLDDYNCNDKYFPFNIALDNEGYIVDRLYPSYFTPSGNVVQIITDHMRAHFLDKINNCEGYIAAHYKYEDEETIVTMDNSGLIPQRVTSDDKFLYTYRFISLKPNEDNGIIFNEIVDEEKSRNFLLDMLKKQKIILQERIHLAKKDKNSINMFDIFEFYHLPYENLMHLDNYSNTVFSDEVRKNIANLLESQLFIINYYLNLCLESTNAKEALLKYYRMQSCSRVDTLVSLLDFDKIERQLYKDKTSNRLVFRDITTSKLNINEVFFNYLIMDYNIRQIPKYVLDKKTNRFINISNNINEFSYVNMNKLETDYYNEIKLIKKKVPKQLRYKYLI